MAKQNADFGYFNGIGNSSNAALPIQTLTKTQKTKDWKKACVDALEREGMKQLYSNLRFGRYRKMINGEFTYSATGFESPEMDMPWFNAEVRKLRADRNIPTYIKHFDFIGIIVNALSGIYSDFDDVFAVDSKDEYFTNEYIRQKTEMMHQNAQLIFKQELDRMLLQRGIDVDKSDFQSEEEQQAHQQQIQQASKALTPAEIEQTMSKNFKILAVEWGQHVLDEDRERFYLTDLERREFTNYLLSGRYFRHYRVGYDSYYIEEWKPEETFFSQDVDARFPQDGEYVGRITRMAPSAILNRYGHLMSLKEQEAIGNYWNQTKNWNSAGGAQVDSKSSWQRYLFPTPVTVPFHNYYDHEINLQMEEAFGQPFAVRTEMDDDGNEHNFRSWIPRFDNQIGDFSVHSQQFLRDDIDVRTDTIKVTEGYWRSQRRMAVLIYKNELGSISVELVDDDLMSDFLKEEEIKKLRNVSLQELQTALRKSRLEEYLNTITYFYVPEVWQFVKIRGNGTTMKEDLYLHVKPLDYQIKGENSNIYDVKLPVTGIIDVGIAPKLEPYQQLHNICMNQITELLEKELGVIFVLDITGLPSEYQDETTEESLFRIRDIAKDTGLLGLDLSRQNTQGNSPNIFQRQDIVYATQVEYRWQLAQQYKQEALNQIGITPQMLGQPNTYVTSEGVKQGAQASYALINPIFEKVNTAKAKGMEVHLAIAQYCQVNGKDSAVMFRKGDGDLRLLDILAEDGELFPLRQLGVMPMTSSKDRKIAEQIRQFVLNDNTVQRDYADVINLLTSPALAEMKDIVQKMRQRSDQQVQEQRQFESEQLDKQLQSQAQELQIKREHETNLQKMADDTDIEQARIQAYGRLGDNEQFDQSYYDRIDNVTQNAISNDFRSTELNIKQEDLKRKDQERIDRNKAEIQKLALKAQELKLKERALETQRFTSVINKN